MPKKSKADSSKKSKGDEPKSDVPDIDKLINDVIRLMPDAVKSACRPYNPRPSPEEMKDIGQEILFLLIKNHCHYLLTFEHLSSLKTWFYQIVRRDVKRRLQKPTITIGLDDVSADSLSYESVQELMLIAEEERKVLALEFSRRHLPQ